MNLSTVSSPVVNGRCMGCGRFIHRSESHFHSPPPKFRGRPRAHLWVDGGGMVSRCDDVEVAHQFITRKYRYVNEETQEEAELAFPVGRAVIERGRVNPVPDGDWSWYWQALPDDAKGPGVTTAVVWRL